MTRPYVRVTGAYVQSAERLVRVNGVYPPAQTPGSILNIGPNAGQNHFLVQIAPTGGTAFETHTQDEIAAGYTDPAHFFVTSGSSVGLRPRADGPTTSGSTFARDELRELNLTGGNMKFNALTEEHWIRGLTRIVHTPANDPDVVIAQLHNGDADRIAIRTQMFSTGVTRLLVRINGSSVQPYLLDPYIFGTDFEWKIRLINGVAEIYFNNMTTPFLASTALVQTTHVDGWYFKVGAYNQFNVTALGATGLGVAPDEYSEVYLKNLSHWHTGWPP